jgi:large subunit ribosomal protein L21
MYAIIVDGGRQFKVEEGQQLEIDFRGDLAAGAEVLFDRVLLIGGGAGESKLGQPTVAGAAVKAEVVGASQGPKHVVQKFRRRKNSRRKTGHRQIFTTVKISKIQTA